MAGLVTFTITPDGGEPATIVVSKMDTLLVERELGQPVILRAQEGYFEPLLRLAYKAATREQAVPAGTTFEQFVDGWDVSLETPEDESGNA